MAAVTVVHSQSLRTFHDRNQYRDLVPLRTGTYGIEIQGGRHVRALEVRVGTNTARPDAFRSAQISWTAQQAVALTWARHEVTLTIGDTSVRYPATWQIGDAVRVSVRGRARVHVSRLAGTQIVETVAVREESGRAPADLVIAGADLAKGGRSTA